MTEEDPSAEPDTSVKEAMPNWDRLMTDMTEMARDYEDDGWTALTVHPGDIAAFPGEAGRRGLELLAPDNEFDPIAEAFDATEGFDSAAVYRAVESGMVYLLIVLEAPDTETVLLLPAYYSHGNDTAFVDMLETADTVPVHVRPLDERRILTFSHDEPDLFLPPD